MNKAFCLAGPTGWSRMQNVIYAKNLNIFRLTKTTRNYESISLVELFGLVHQMW